MRRLHHDSAEDGVIDFRQSLWLDPDEGLVDAWVLHLLGVRWFVIVGVINDVAIVVCRSAEKLDRVVLHYLTLHNIAGKGERILDLSKGDFLTVLIDG